MAPFLMEPRELIVDVDNDPEAMHEEMDEVVPMTTMMMIKTQTWVEYQLQ